MFVEKIRTFSRILFTVGLIFAASGFLFTGCARICPIVFDPYVYGPQLIVNPGSASLGVPSLMGTDIVFEGVGFEPGDSVFITLERSEDKAVVVADGRVEADGTFTAEVGLLSKVTNILRGDIAFDTYSEEGKYGQTLLLSRKPIPAGTYTARATGMLSDKEAKTQFTFTEPSAGDRIKHRIAMRLGRIKIVGPQVVAKPGAVSLGIASLMGTDIVFEGVRFEPDDIIFITLVGPEGEELVVAESTVQPDGTFSAKMGLLSKVTTLLHGDIIFDTYSEEGEYTQTLIVPRKTIPPGEYTVLATGVLSNQEAETALTLKKPSLVDRIKDYIGVKLGKIKYMEDG